MRYLLFFGVEDRGAPISDNFEKCFAELSEAEDYIKLALKGNMWIEYIELLDVKTLTITDYNAYHIKKNGEIAVNSVKELTKAEC